MTILTLNGVSKTFTRGASSVRAVHDVSLDIGHRETVGLIGESGSGKSTLGRIALGLIEPDEGAVLFEGTDMLALPRRERRRTREHLTVVFQEPFESLNPRLKVGEIVGEPLSIHRPDMGGDERRRKVAEALELVQLPAEFVDRYPSSLSGGQQQRVGIARAVVTQPRMIVLDEPTSSLDVSVRARIISLLADLQSAYDLSYLFISHDIHTVRYISDRIAVMYQGRIIEAGPADLLFERPAHPYTRALLSASLVPDMDSRPERMRLGGDPSIRPAAGCPLAPRCPFVDGACREIEPVLVDVATDHQTACIRIGEIRGDLIP